MPQLKDLMKSITEMSHDEAVQLVRRLRQARRDYVPRSVNIKESEGKDIPKARAKAKTKPKAKTKKADLKAILSSLSPEDIKRLVKEYSYE